MSVSVLFQQLAHEVPKSFAEFLGGVRLRLRPVRTAAGYSGIVTVVAKEMCLLQRSNDAMYPRALDAACIAGDRGAATGTCCTRIPRVPLEYSSGAIADGDGTVNDAER
jgi:hypothetical protein